MTPARKLIVNADDFGFTRGVNEGIVEAHRRGILTATTLMANGGAFEHAVELARANPQLDIGCHLVLVQGESVLTGRPLPASMTELLRRVATGKLRIYEELSAQARKIVAAGILPSHLDTHKHTHLLPPVLDAVSRVAQEQSIKWVRRPFDFPLDGKPGSVPVSRRIVSRSLGLLRRRFHRVLISRGCRTTDHFAGFQLTGRLHTRELVTLIRRLPEGSTELMCHPGYCDGELLSAATRLTTSRDEELAALVAPETRQALTEGQVELVNYRQLVSQAERQ